MRLLSIPQKILYIDNMKETPNDKLVSLIRTLPRVELHNRLMVTSDRELALSMLYMNDEDRVLLLKQVTKGKAGRIEEEMQLQTRLRITYVQYRMAIENVIERLTVTKGSPSLKSYLRPRRYS